jgi:hypothetical protein
MDLGTKMAPGRTKNQSDQNHFKMDVCVGLVVTNPTQLEQAQTDVVCERFRVLFVSPNKKIFANCTVCKIHTVLTWKLII